MRKILTCFFIVLLLSAGTTLATLTLKTSAQTQDIKIVDYKYYIDNAGYLDIIGEVKNVGSNTIEYVRLAGTVYTADGTVLGSLTGRAFVSHLTPQQSAPFLMDSRAPNQPATDWYTAGVSRVTVEVTQANAVNSHQYPDLKITSSSASVSTAAEDAGTYWVTGSVQNVGTQAATNLTVVAAFYNSSNNVIAVGYTNYLTPSTLSPSGTAQFKIGAFDTNQTQPEESLKITSYKLLVQTQLPILDGPGPTATDQAPTSANPGTSNPQTSTQDGNSNDTSNQNTLYIIVVAVIVAAAVGFLFVLRRRKPKPAELQDKPWKNRPKKKKYA